MAERLYEEFRELSNHPDNNCGITVGLVNGSNFDWTITLTAPIDTVYKGGLFILRAHFPPDYPIGKPEVYFITPIYHLNVKPTAPKTEGEESLGHVCISTLIWWNPQYKMKEVLLNIYSLFYMHNPDCAYGTDRAQEYNDENGVIYFEKAKHFTQKYANPKNNKNNNYNNYDRSQDWDFNL